MDARQAHYLETVLRDRPDVLWPLWESGGTVAADLSGNERHGTFVGTYQHGGSSPFPGQRGTLFANGQVNSPAITLAGDGNCTEGMTHEVWFLRRQFATGMTANLNNVTAKLYGSGRGMAARFTGNPGNLDCYYGTGAYRLLTLPSTSQDFPTYGRPYHLVFATSPQRNETIIVLNGKVVTSTSNLGNPQWLSTVFSVGGTTEDATVSRNMDGGVAWAAMYSYGLTGLQAAAHYRAGIGMFRDARRLGVR